MKRLLAGLLTMSLAATCVACSSSGAETDGRGRTVTGVHGVDGSTWDVELLAAVRGLTDRDGRGEPEPCLVLFVIMKATTRGELTVPRLLPITATVDGVTSNGEYLKCSSDGTSIGFADPFGEWPGQFVAPGAEIGLAVGFPDIDGELPDSVRLQFGVDGPSRSAVDARLIEDTPPLRELAIGSVPDLQPAETEFEFVDEGDVATQQVLGYDVVPGTEGGSCLRLYVRARVSTVIDDGPPSLLPQPEVVVNGVSTGTWPGGCASAPGFVYLSPGTPTVPWPADVPYGVVYTYWAPADATVQAVVVEDQEKLVAIAVEQLDGPPPAP